MPLVPAVSEVVVTWKLTTDTVRVKLWVASAPIPLWAVKVTGKLPLWVGVPESTPPLKVPPAGSAPVWVMVDAGPVDGEGEGLGGR